MVFPNTLSDFKMKREFEMNKTKKDADEKLQALMGGVGRLGSMAGSLASKTASGVTTLAKSTAEGVGTAARRGSISPPPLAQKTKDRRESNMGDINEQEIKDGLGSSISGAIKRTNSIVGRSIF